MDDEAAAAIVPHLAPGEKLLWSGRPSPDLYAWNNGAGLLVVGVMLAFGSVAGFGVAAALIVLGIALIMGILFRKGLAQGWWGRPFEIDAFIGVAPSRELAQLVRRFVGRRT